MNRIAIGLALLILFGFATYLSGQYAVANTYLQNASNIVSLTPRNEAPSEIGMAIARAQINEALSILPNDPDNLDLAGRILYLTALNSSSEAQGTALLQESKRLHIKALEARQYWPYSYVNLVYSKSALGEIDVDYENHFKSAYMLGLDDRDVIRDLLYAGINDWNQITPELQELTVTLAIEVLQQKIVSPRGLRPYLESEGQLFRLCAQMEQFEEKVALCNS